MKKLSIIAMSLLLIVGTLLLINADENNPRSTATISFEEGDGPTKPVIPPTEGGGDEDNNGTGATGPLTVDFVPNLNFGTQKIKSTAQSFKTTNLFPYVQVTDTRGTGEKWFLTMSLSDFTHEKDSSETIKDAKITFNNGLVNRAVNDSSNDTVTSIVHDGSIVNTEPKIVVTSGGVAKTIMEAPNGDASGTWFTSWGKTVDDIDTNSNVVLNIDTSNAKIGTYTATADWTVTSEQP